MLIAFSNQHPKYFCKIRFLECRLFPNIFLGIYLTLRGFYLKMNYLRKPNFIGIGTEKAGTTWLYNQLINHPKVSMPEPKELRYFIGTQKSPRDIDIKRIQQQFNQLKSSQKDRQTQLQSIINSLKTCFGDNDDYLSIFSELPTDHVVGEISPQYVLMGKNRILEMAKVTRDARLIYLLRDPVERAISGAKMVLNNNKKPLNAEAIIAVACEKTQIRFSTYHETIRNFSDAFGESNLFIAFYDQLKNDPKALLKEVCEHIQVEYQDSFFSHSQKFYNKGQDFELSKEEKLEIYHKLSTAYEKLEPLFPEQVSLWKGKYI